MGTCTSSSNKFTDDEIFALFLYVKTSSGDMNLYESSNKSYCKNILTKKNHIEIIKKIINDPNEIKKLEKNKSKLNNISNISYKNILNDYNIHEFMLPESYNIQTPKTKTLTIHNRYNKYNNNSDIIHI